MTLDYFEMVMDDGHMMFYWSDDNACYTGPGNQTIH